MSAGCAFTAAPSKLPTRFPFQFHSPAAQILELLEHTPIFSAGYKCVLHIHSVVEECECVEMRYELDPKTKSKKRVGPSDVCLVQTWRMALVGKAPSLLRGEQLVAQRHGRAPAPNAQS